MLPSPPSTLFPCTTLFRSASFTPSLLRSPITRETSIASTDSVHGDRVATVRDPPYRRRATYSTRCGLQRKCSPRTVTGAARSEEHTSELQSPVHLVCRLLLDAALSAIYTLSLHDALPICLVHTVAVAVADHPRDLDRIDGLGARRPSRNGEGPAVQAASDVLHEVRVAAEVFAEDRHRRGQIGRAHV